jgi:hypothetical protein
VSLSSSSS